MLAVNLPITAKVNQMNRLEIGGCDLIELVKEFGTPLYIMDEATIRSRCQAYLKTFRVYYPNSEVIFASKALCTIGISEIIKDEGLGFDVASGGELYTVLKAGADPKKIYYHGNNKSLQEIGEGLGAGVGRFVIDNPYELKNLDKMTQATGRRAQILLRVNPGIEAHTHEFIQTGRTDSKFGVPLDQLEDLIKKVEKTKLISWLGFHAHIGSQIFDVAPFVVAAKLLLELTQKYGAEEIDLGGGIGIPYLSDEKEPSIVKFAEEIAKVFIGKTNAKLIIEPGRSIVGTAGVTLYTIGAIHVIPGARKYLIVDGGMADNPRYILYGAKYEARLAHKPAAHRDEVVTIAGRFCEAGDILIKDGKLPPAEVGDIIAVAATGAYNYSMASNYNRVGRPAMVLVNKGQASTVVKRETYGDLISNDAV